ncbi:MAG: antibiotic ABC transporter ATP-binding protein [candidate division Zixibacteria bacterium RBG_16_53_22]|nr:MAG: antibiotic ABC transporter ATP-binding protein [candidate division Zixibacteria bacterium RBG_16_53_22]
MAYDGYGQEEEILGKAYDARLARRLTRYLKPYRLRIGLAILVLMIAKVAELAGPYITMIAIDRYITTRNLSGLSGMIGLYIAVLALQFVMEYIEVYTTQWVGQKVMFDLRMKIFSHIEHLGLSFFDKNPVGRLVTRTTSDVAALNELFTAGVVAVFGDIIMLMGIIGVMFYLNWQLALVNMVVVPIIFVATLIFRSKVRESFRRVRSRIAKLNSFLQEHVTGMWVVQSFVAEKKTFEKFDAINADLRDNHLKSVFYFAVFFPVVEILGAVSLALIIWYGGGQILLGALTFGALVAFIQYAERFFQPIRDLSEKYNILQQAMASSERIFRLLDTKTDVVDSQIPRSFPHVRGAIRFENVSFAYNENEWVLKDINIDIKPGERIAIVGATGAGKTSIISLLLRFYNFQKGDIKLDGVSIKELPLKEYRRHIGLVLQDIFVFSGDIARNVRLGNENISDEAVVDVLRAVGAEQFVGSLEGGINHQIRERGSNLSVGQRQLLAFARALAFDPRILVLDEATSSVDTQTEIVIQRALQRLLAGRTSIVIAHRLSTIKNSDRIIVMHKGQIKEEGSHAQLLTLGGIYHRLYQLQYKDQEIESRVVS